MVEVPQEGLAENPSKGGDCLAEARKWWSRGGECRMQW